MNSPQGVNVHDPQYREAKQPQGNPATPVAQLFQLNDRTVIVTGASGFLGVQAATAILESGGDVVGLDILASPRSAAWAAVEESAKTHGRGLWYFACNVVDENAVAAVFTDIAKAITHPIRGLVACAGRSISGPATEFAAKDFRALVDLNLMGTFLVARATARAVQATGASTFASFVLVASMSGHVSNKGTNTAAYCASKAAVHQLARSLAAEWGSRPGIPLIRVNTLSPGYIRTVATEAALKRPGVEAQWTGDNMLFRLSTADEFRAPIVFLLSDGSSFMTGADLRVDGGHCAW